MLFVPLFAITVGSLATVWVWYKVFTFDKRWHMKEREKYLDSPQYWVDIRKIEEQIKVIEQN